jgi:hypothetical protein
MPAKPCPSCGLKNPERATTCDCGYHFGGPRLLECPSCGERSWPSEMTCPCGHLFAEDTEETRHMLTHRLTLGWFTFAGGLLVLATGILSLKPYSLLTSIGLMIAGSGGVGKVAGWCPRHAADSRYSVRRLRRRRSCTSSRSPDRWTPATSVVRVLSDGTRLGVGRTLVAELAAAAATVASPPRRGSTATAPQCISANSKRGRSSPGAVAGLDVVTADCIGGRLQALRVPSLCCKER